MGLEKKENHSDKAFNSFEMIWKLNTTADKNTIKECIANICL